MAIREPKLGTVKYNDWDFPGPVVVKLRCTPVRDFANRTTKYYHYALTFSTVIVPSDIGGTDSNDPFVGSLRATLMRPGKRLVVVGHGLGRDLDVSSSNCIGFGPVPTSYSFEIVGAALCGRLVWTVEFDIPHCSYSGIGRATVPIGDLSYGLNYSIDESGLTTRTITGQAEIAVYSNDMRKITATADAIIDTINPSLPEGFLRRKSYTVSPDKRFLNFTITDRELGTTSTYPLSIVRADIAFSISSDPNIGTVAPFLTRNAGNWFCELSGTMEVAQGISKGYALAAVLLLAKARLKKMTKGDNQENNPVPSAILLTSINLRDSIYSQKLEVNMTWTVVGTTLKNLLAKSGVWEPIGAGWTNWQQSSGIRRSIMQPRGYAQLAAPATDDVIVTFCTPGSIVDSKAMMGPYTPYQSNLTQSKYTSDNSWIQYKLESKTEKQSDTILHRPARQSRDSQKPLAPVSEGDNFRVDGGNENPPGSTSGSASTQQDVSHIQERSSAKVVITLTGHAIRIGYPIAGSDLAAVENGTEIYSHVDGPKRIAFTPERIPIYEVRWKRVYYQTTGGSATLAVDKKTIPKSRLNYVRYTT